MRATRMPLQWCLRCAKDASMTRVTMPVQFGWQCQHDVGNDASMTTLGSCRCCCCHHHCCWVVCVIFSKAKKELVLEFLWELVGKLALTGLVLRPALYWILSSHPIIRPAYWYLIISAKCRRYRSNKHSIQPSFPCVSWQCHLLGHQVPLRVSMRAL